MKFSTCIAALAIATGVSAAPAALTTVTVSAGSGTNAPVATGTTTRTGTGPLTTTPVATAIATFPLAAVQSSVLAQLEGALSGVAALATSVAASKGAAASDVVNAVVAVLESQRESINLVITNAAASTSGSASTALLNKGLSIDKTLKTLIGTITGVLSTLTNPKLAASAIGISLKFNLAIIKLLLKDVVKLLVNVVSGLKDPKTLPVVLIAELQSTLGNLTGGLFATLAPQVTNTVFEVQDPLAPIVNGVTGLVGGILTPITNLLSGLLGGLFNIKKN